MLLLHRLANCLGLKRVPETGRRDGRLFDYLVSHPVWRR